MGSPPETGAGAVVGRVELDGIAIWAEGVASVAAAGEAAVRRAARASRRQTDAGRMSFTRQHYRRGGQTNQVRRRP